eukprot:3281931-Amphidinium_carterae.1
MSILALVKKLGSAQELVDFDTLWARQAQDPSPCRQLIGSPGLGQNINAHVQDPLAVAASQMLTHTHSNWHLSHAVAVQLH